MEMPSSREFPSSSVFRTRDAGEVEAHLRDLYGSLAMSSDRVEFSQTVHGDAEFALTEFTYGGRFDIGGEIDLVTVGVVDAGFGYEVGDESGWSGAQPVLFQPDQRIVCRLDDVVLRGVTFGAAELARDVGALLGTELASVRFASARPRDPERGAAWAGQLAAATRDVATSPVALAATRGALTRLLLETFPLADAELDRRVGAVGRWMGYRRAVEFIEEHASLPITLADIANAARLPAAELDAAFRTHSPHGETALGHLQRVRLVSAHRDLAQSDPDRTTVAEIASRWGFATRGSFAGRYRRAFGVWPGRSLRG